VRTARRRRAISRQTHAFEAAAIRYAAFRAVAEGATPNTVDVASVDDDLRPRDTGIRERRARALADVLLDQRRLPADADQDERA
jgi:hypothetical protein